MADAQTPGPAPAFAALRNAWRAIDRPRRETVGEAVIELQSAAMVGEGSSFERGAHVSALHFNYFKPPETPFLSSLRSRDRRSAKEWEYINAAGVWLDISRKSLEKCMEDESGGVEKWAARLSLVAAGMDAAMEVLLMRAQYFDDITGHGVEMARQMAMLVESQHDAVQSASYKAVKKSLANRIDTEAAKILARTHLERASARSGSSASGTGTPGGSAAGSAAGGDE